MQLMDLLKIIGKENLILPWPFNTYDVKGVSADSRTVAPDEIFVAVPCPQAYDNVLLAIEKGCKVIIAQLEICDQYLNKYSNVLFLVHENPRLALCHILNFLYPQKPQNLFAVTGTNGKSSTVHFIKQLLTMQGINTATIGTLGVDVNLPEKAKDEIFKILGGVSLTTLDPIRLHKILHKLKENKIDHVAFEASSHGLHQYRIHELNINKAAFTNLTQDHLDYHRTMDQYYEAKKILFSEILTPGGKAIINIDDAWGRKLVKELSCKKYEIITFSALHSDASVQILNMNLTPQKSIFDIRFGKTIYKNIECSLVADFQIFNAITAALMIANDENDFKDICHFFKDLKSVEGRMETYTLQKNIHIFVDYAHTPDALEKVLANIQKVCKGEIHLVFGCGGNRDVEKRFLMGKISAEYAQHIYVTDDNPRLEDPSKIRQDIIKGIQQSDNSSPAVNEISHRKQAIIEAIRSANPYDCILVAGKGHEKFQIVGQTLLPFSDSEIIKNEIENIEKNAQTQ